METGKAPGTDGIRRGNLERVGEDNMWSGSFVCVQVSWESSKIPQDSKRGITVPIYKAKGDR